MYARTENQIKREYARKRKAAAQFVKLGYFPDWAEEHRNDPERGLKQYSTPAKWAAYQAGKIDRKKAVELATARAWKEIDEQERKQIEKLRTAETAANLKYIDISVEWTRSRNWGNIPHATIRTNAGIYTGTAGGCGYDKESAAVATALNNSPEIMRALYDLKEKHPTAPHRELFGYGSGYGILPYFEGGTGISCFESILNRCGFVLTSRNSGKTFDIYHFERKARGGAKR